jgi:hypothetical protein
MTIALQSITSILCSRPVRMMTIISILSTFLELGRIIVGNLLVAMPKQESIAQTSAYNTLRAFMSIIEQPYAPVNPAKISSNRINNVGDALEGFIKDAYCDLIGKRLSENERDLVYCKAFSWLGNAGNPPDSMLRGGDGIEVKKIQTLNSSIALNSSAPKNKLYASDSRIATGAKTAEDWTEKDIVYAIGSVPNKDLKRLWLIYGDCYAASKDIYERLSSVVAKGVQQLPDIQFQKTNELGRVNKVDPLGITNLRVRGMWHIENPSRLYSHLVSATRNRQYYLLMREEKYQSFTAADRKAIENITLKGFDNSIIEIRDPDNPAKLIRARFIKYEL